MAELSYPSPTYNSRNVTDAEYERTASMHSDSGVHGSPADSAVVTAGTGLQVLVKAGKLGNVRGFAWDSGAADTALTIAANASGATRYDLVVLRLDRTTWNVRAAIVQGTGGSGDPALTQQTTTTGKYEICIGRVAIANGASTVTVTQQCTYVGSRVRVANDGLAPPNPSTGELQFRPNTGEWRGYDGTKWVTVYGDTGWLPLTAGFSTWNFIFDTVGRRRGESVSLRIWARRTTEAFSINDTDGGSHVATLPAALRPSYGQFVPCVFSNGATARLYIKPDGQVWVYNHNKTVPVGSDLAATANYLI